MESRWSDDDAQAYCDRYSDWSEDLALRVYTTHLIGSDTSLVMHGGGNTSVKSGWTDVFGEEQPAVYVTGSGWSLDSIQPQGFTPVDVEAIQKLRQLDSLGDEEMVNQHRSHKFDTSYPDPSVETLLHAFLPHKFIDHSHADAVVGLTNQPDGMERIEDLFGDRLAVLPYVMPGFELAKRAAEAVDEFSDCDGLLLHRHGLFTFGDDAKTAYELHIEMVDRAEGALEPTPSVTVETNIDAARSRAAEIAPILRGLLADRSEEPPKRMILTHHASDGALAFAESDAAERLCGEGPLTPDHVIRTKANYLYVPSIDDPRADLEAAVDGYIEDYEQYFETNRGDRDLVQLDPFPRVIVSPGIGIFTAGKTLDAAETNIDIFEHTQEIKRRAEAMSGYESLDDSHLFDVEYWSLEQAKLGNKQEPPLARQVAVITGAAGAIGSGVAEVLASQGAHVMLSDIDEEALDETVAELQEKFGPTRIDGQPADVTDRADVEALLDITGLRFGGVDIVVPNAGTGTSEPILEAEPEHFEQTMDVNYMGYVHLIQAAAERLVQQRTGGNIVVISSKNVFSPGAGFSSYSASKAAGHQFGRIAAMEFAEHDIRVNMVNPDAVFTRGGKWSGLWEEVGPGRAEAHDVDMEDLPDYYRQRNLLKAEVTAQDVGRAVAFFARNETPTTGSAMPVDGGVASAFPR